LKGINVVGDDKPEKEVEVVDLGIHQTYMWYQRQEDDGGS